MYDLIRDAPLGQFIRAITSNKYLQYPEERPDFTLPPQYTRALNSSPGEKITTPSSPSDDDGIDEINETDTDTESLNIVRTTTITRPNSQAWTPERFEAERTVSLQRTKTLPIAPQKTQDGIVLVDWYTTDDPANPYNWSRYKRAFVVFLLCSYTFVVYIGSSIYAPAHDAVMHRFGVSAAAASVPLSVYVVAYGVGPLVFAPLSEIPIIGRNPIYIVGTLLFFVISFPTAVTEGFGSFIALRFLQGLFGSPAVANAGASFSDVYSIIYVGYPLSWWCYFAWAGPATGPVIAGFAVQAENWHWPMWELVWMSGPMLLVMIILLPETSSSNILLRRAQRLRKLTGNDNLQSQSEIDQRHLTASGIFVDAIIKPVEIVIKDPAVLFVNAYTSLFYGIYFTFFEVFPLVFPPYYGFNLGQTGLAFLACEVGASIGLLGYFAYLHFYMIPLNLKHGLQSPERWLMSGLVGSVMLSVGLFIFAWTARADIHFLVPLVGVVIFAAGTMPIFQAIFVWLPLTYPKYAASLFAGNDLSRASMAAGSVMFARPLFINVGVDKGVTLLGGLSVGGIFGMAAIIYWGAGLRAKSKFANKA
ncbi:MFS general substrate transporter [Polyplosphaeria fusca]|uniref:MFS general substrate transporter n=1 Tax=Polyplosphaeria fusca TaxID=682080 RepID=A0A9P4QH07_9PLEO|nr:MFS general substrate transporter [Polyplosphaeria fusca]